MTSGGLVYDDVYGVYDGGYAVMEKGSTADVVKSDGTVVRHTVEGQGTWFDVIPWYLSKGFVMTTSSGLNGVMSTSGEEIVKPLYQSVDVSNSASFIFATEMSNGEGFIVLFDAEGNLLDRQSCGTVGDPKDFGAYWRADDSAISVYKGGRPSLYFAVENGKLVRLEADASGNMMRGTACDGTEFSVIMNYPNRTIKITANGQTKTLNDVFGYEIVGELILVQDTSYQYVAYRYDGSIAQGFGPFSSSSHLAALRNGSAENGFAERYLLVDSASNAETKLLASDGSTIKTVAKGVVGGYGLGSYGLSGADGGSNTPFVYVTDIANGYERLLINFDGDVVLRYSSDKYVSLLGEDKLVVRSDTDAVAVYRIIGGLNLAEISAGNVTLAEDQTGTWNSVYNPSADAFWAKDSAGKWGLVREGGEVIVPFEYSGYYDCGLCDTSLVLVKRGGKWFFFDTAEAPSKPQVSFSDVSDATPHADDVR